MKTMLVIGLGRFGTNLACNLAELGNEVMVLDSDEEKVNLIANSVDEARIGDGTDETVLRELGVEDFDNCFVCLAQDFQSSLEITAGLKELGAKKIVVKTDSERHARLLMKIGADEIIFPERDMARRAAMKYTASNALEYFELTPAEFFQTGSKDSAQLRRIRRRLEELSEEDLKLLEQLLDRF